ncbi:glutaredoxin family protein [Neomoorella humiferrea]|uniref:glutaredoxin family protein n=1 Tax=Neomoorella humiferrea TaxID=676965 RepID=UPI000D036350|nr:glutaredoxin family protein [Moorella humiferrea]
MKEYLSRHGVNFEEKDISVDEKAMEELCRRNGGLAAVPTLIVDGQVIVGFDENRLKKVLH